MMHLPSRGALWRMACGQAKLWSAARITALTKLGEDIETTPAERDEILTQVRQVLRGYPVIVHKGESTWADVSANASERLVMARQLRNDLTAKLKVPDAKSGIEIEGATSSAVELVLKHIPAGEEAHELGEWLLESCPDPLDVRTSSPTGEVTLRWDQCGSLVCGLVVGQ